MSVVRWTSALLALAAATTSLGAQEPVADTAALVSAIREATVRYQDRDAAVAAGYRLIGPDFPGMGEHWVNVGVLMGNVLDARHPAVLSYATIDGRPVLTGVAFAKVVGPEDSLPTFPAGKAAWHFHMGSIEDESFGPHGHMMGAAGTRLAVVHTWVWLPNPAGLFARDNWALPYVRAGLEPPAVPEPDAARALAAGIVNRPYYRMRWMHAGLGTDTLDHVLDAHGAAVRTVIAEPPKARDRDLAALWRALCKNVGKACSTTQ